MEKSPEVRDFEKQFRKILEAIPRIVGYHGFRVVADSPEKIIVVADVDAAEHVPEMEYQAITEELASKVKETLPNVSYSTFHVTPKFSY